MITIMLLHHTTTILRPFFRDYPGEPVPEENFWTLYVCILRARVQPTLDPYAEAFIASPLR